MTAIRSLIAQRHLAMLLCLAALLMKFVVPTGYMIGEAQGRWAIIPVQPPPPWRRSCRMIPPPP